MNGKQARALRRAAKLHPHAPSSRRHLQGLKTRWQAMEAKDRPKAARIVQEAVNRSRVDRRP